MQRTIQVGTIILLVLMGLLTACGAGAASLQRGEETAADYGCYGCHGDRGEGGIANPGSPLGTVPGWQTRAFAEVFGREDGTPDREKIAYMISDGAEAYYEKYMSHDAAAQTVARSISEWERQMPAYQGEMTSDEIEDVVSFVISLNPFFKE